MLLSMDVAQTQGFKAVAKFPSVTLNLWWASPLPCSLPCACMKIVVTSQAWNKNNSEANGLYIFIWNYFLHICCSNSCMSILCNAPRKPLMKFLFYRWWLQHFGEVGKEWLAWNLELRSSVSSWWLCGSWGGKVGCETGLIRQGFKSGSSAGALVAVSGVSGHGLAEWSQDTRAQHGSRRRKQLLQQRQPRSAKDIQLHVPQMSQSSWHGACGILVVWSQLEGCWEHTRAVLKTAAAVVACRNCRKKSDIAELTPLPSDAR